MSSGSNSNIPVKKEGGHPGKSIWLLWRTLFEIDNHYTPIKPIGKGAYGVVCSAKNALSGEKVAIKKITNAFENVTDSRRTLREITLLRYLKHENIIAVRDILRPPSRDLFHDVYLVYELMDTDLHQIIRSPQDLTDDHCQYFIYQVLRGLKYVHSANVLHRDLRRKSRARPCCTTCKHTTCTAPGSYRRSVSPSRPCFSPCTAPIKIENEK